MGRRQLDPMRNVDWGMWCEDVDGAAYAAIAVAEETHRGAVYRAGTFLLVPRGTPRHRARQEAREKLEREMASGVHRRRLPTSGSYMHRFGMPLVAWLRDLRR